MSVNMKKSKPDRIIGLWKYNYESTPKSHFTPKSPKGDFGKMLIFNTSPSGVGVKKG